jgi:Cdc6-like AAA superfamily ATPase
MNRSTLPDINPFPRNTVVSTSIRELPDFRATKCYIDAADKLEMYRENLPGREGLIFGVRGRFGSGKTHLVHQLMDTLREQKQVGVKTIYAKADQPDILHVYVSQLMAAFNLKDFHVAYGLHLAKLFRLKMPVEMQPSAPDEKTLLQIAKEQLEPRLKKDPATFLSMVKEDLLPVSGLQRELSEDVAAQTTDGIAADLARAYAHLSGETLGPLAAKWLKGEKLSLAEQKNLGLQAAHNIDTKESVLQALHFLLGAWNKAGFSLMFALDEIERFSSRGTDEDRQKASSLIKDLAEVFKSTGHVLLLVGENGAWRTLPPDVYDRVKRDDIIEIQLADHEARGILNVYCQSAKTTVNALFEEPGVNLLYEASGHNVRRMLDLANKSFDNAHTEGTNRVLERHVQMAASQDLSDKENVERIERAINSIAAEQGYTVQRAATLGSISFNMLLSKPDSARVAIELKKAVFKLDEVETARAIITYSRNLRQEYRDVRFCVVIVGYSTKEVRAELLDKKIVDRVFTEQNFAEEFRAYLSSEELKATALHTASEPESADVALDKIEQVRQQDIGLIIRELEALGLVNARAREETREKRVADKMSETLTELGQFLQREEALGVRGAADPDGPRPASSQEKYALALRLLDKQYDGIQRAQILNGGLPRAEEFHHRLKRLKELTEASEKLWETAIDAVSNRPPADPTAAAQPPGEFFLEDSLPRSQVRQLFRERRETLHVLEALHAERAAAGGQWITATIVNTLRNLSWSAVGLLLLAVLGLSFYLYAMNSAWRKETDVIERYNQSLDEVQKAANRIAIDPALRGDNAIKAGDTLLQAVAQLNAQDPARQSLKYVQYPDISAEVQQIKLNTGWVRQALEADAPTASVPYKAQEYAADLARAAATASGKLSAVSFGGFSTRYLMRNYILLYLSLLFLAGFLSLQLSKRLRRQRLAREARLAEPPDS